MALLNTAQFTLAGTATKRSFGDRLRDRWVTVKDFGAVGDGSTDDTAAIQATFDYVYGEFGDEVGEAASYLSWVVFFPPGLYKTTAPLYISHSWGVNLIGAGSHQSRIFFDPEGDPAESMNIADIYPVIELMTCWHVHMEGLTFDASGVQTMAMLCSTHPDGGGNGDGSDGYYRDVHVTGAVDGALTTGWGVMYSGAAMGSERTWVKCKFTNCTIGYGIQQGNTINHFFYSCLFKDNDYGLYNVGQGGSVSFIGSRGEGSAFVDFKVSSNAASVIGCHSTSQNFLSVDGYVAANTHVSGTEGIFITNANAFPGVPEWAPVNAKTAALVGNRCSNGVIQSDGGDGNSTYATGMFLLGNDFALSGYYDDMLTYYRGSAMLWIDGEQVNPPTPGYWNAMNTWFGDSLARIIISGGNLVATGQYNGGAAHNVCMSAITAHFHGKWYFEVTITAVPSSSWGVGVADVEHFIDSANDIAGSNDALGVVMTATGSNAAGTAVFNNGATYTFDTDPTISNGNVIGVAVNASTRKVWFRYNGTWLKGDPVAGTNGCDLTGIPRSVCPHIFMRPASSTDGVMTLNVGTTSFANTQPTGFQDWG